MLPPLLSPLSVPIINLWIEYNIQYELFVIVGNKYVCTYVFQYLNLKYVQVHFFNSSLPAQCTRRVHIIYT